MAPIETTIKETAVPEQHVVIVTARLLRAFCLRPYVTFALNDRGARSDSVSFASAAAAEQYHERLAQRIAERVS